MTIQEKSEMMSRAKDWFRELAAKHINKTNEIHSLNDFNYNPFLVGYLSRFFGDDPSPENLAKVLLYPRVLGTSINTFFGEAIKHLSEDVFEGFNPNIPGLNIGFIDQRDMVQKYAQLKSGPVTINMGDAQPLIDSYDAILDNEAVQERGIVADNLVVAVIYGERERMHGAYSKIEEHYNVLIGQEFWHAITGDANFYSELIDAIAQIASENEGAVFLENSIARLAADEHLVALSNTLRAQNP